MVEPHPDDGVFAAGGTIARLVMEGNEAYFLTVTDGEKATRDRSVSTSEELRQITRRQGLEATKILGVKEDRCLGYPNHDVTPDLEKELKMKITEVIREIRPNIVMTYDPYAMYEPNPDHRTVAFATYDAVSFCHNHLDYPDQISRGLEPHIVNELWFFDSPQPDYTVDISETLSIKTKAMAAYKYSVVQELEEVKQRLRSAGNSAPLLEQGSLEDLAVKLYPPTVENGRYVEKFKIIRPFISERVPHLIKQGMLRPLEQ